MGVLSGDPLGTVGHITDALGLVAPDLTHLALWLLPGLAVVWIVVSSLGRTLVLRRADPSLHARPATLMLLQLLRMAALGVTLAIWFQSLGFAARVAIQGPMAGGGEPNLVGYCAIVICSSIGLFTAWAAASWIFSAAPLLAMIRNLGPMASLAAALRLGPLQGKLIEINMVLGIVKIALIVLAMVFSATPLPFESVTSTEFLIVWWAGVTVFYLIASDFFHVARLLGYLALWRAYEQP